MMADKTPRVSVLMPAYNHENYVVQAIESVCRQTCQDIELIVVDDCSTDSTHERVLALSGSAPIPMKVVRNAQNLGIAGTLDKALGLSRGEFVCILASDDAYASEFIAACLDRLEAAPHGVETCVHTNAYRMDESGDVTGVYLEDSGRRPLKGEVFWDLIGPERFGIVSSTLFLRKSLLSSVGGFDITLKAEDYDLHLRLSRKARFDYIDKPLFYARHVRGSLGRRPWLYADGSLHALEKHADEMGARYRDIMRRKTFGYSRSCFEYGSPRHGLRLFRKGLGYSSPKHFPFDAAFLSRAATLGYGRHLAVSVFPDSVRIAIQDLKKYYRRGRMQRLEYGRATARAPLYPASPGRKVGGSLRQGLLDVLPAPVRSQLRRGKTYVKRLGIWRDVRRLVRGYGPADRRVLRESAMRAPILSARSLDRWCDPVLLDDAQVVVEGVGRFSVRAHSDDLWHVLPTREPAIFDAISSLLRPGDVFVDAGANIGFYTVLASNAVGPIGQVFAVEMMPDTAVVLRGHVGINELTNVRLIEKALSDRAGETVTAHVTEGKFGQASISVGGGGRAVEVETTTLDAALADVARIRLMKMDLEGAEEMALRGAEAVLARTDMLIFECWTEETLVADFLALRGFSVRSLDGRNRIAFRG